MNRGEFYKELHKLLYIEDTNAIDTMMACVVANSLMIGDPVWLTLVGPSSAGKSQLIRPYIKANPGLFLQIDDLTENAFISGQLREKSKLFEIKGSGIIAMDDLTVLFSKGNEEKAAILSQFRMLYDGRLTRVFGNSKDGKSTCTWEGFAGLLAGSTPAIYRHFSEVADMGERFVIYRMKDIDVDKLMEMVMGNSLPASELDEKISNLYKERIQTIVQSDETLELSEEVMERLKTAAKWCTLLRTPVQLDWRGEYMTAMPVPESPVRVYKQLLVLAKAFARMAKADGEKELPEEYIRAIEWVAYSIADDLRRETYETVMRYGGNKASRLAGIMGFDQRVVQLELVKLQSIGLLETNHSRDAEEGSQGYDNEAVYKTRSASLDTLIFKLKNYDDTFRQTK